MKESVKQKILLLLGTGLVLAFSRSPRHHWRVIEDLPKAWREIERRELYRKVKELYKSKMVSCKEKPGGETEIILTEKGKKQILIYNIDKIKIQKSEKWDKKWRVVIFDIPEKSRMARDALRRKLKELEFRELQKSVFVHPYECKKEIDFIIEFFNLRPYVRYIVAESIDNQDHLRLKFNLILERLL